jgi:ribosomal protein L29
MNKVHKELSEMSLEQLESRVEEMRRELFKLRLSTATTHIKSFASTQKALKRAIACGLTYMEQKKQ